ncbi:uncharacterized protein BDZ99DRAFT_576927 [Mytilinidion resinicola]|uniref:Uncharacterized protein n=1 Tax=Mytilinidion resinicola TaxID=574789 RepID=A0A6A6Y0C6_9PEZI|nr:uncharacterized protein BDZ99DRAFT_576927 [Mytilinidion resinicola]KAF2802222.1 hypothetical protein BDZ99DRAFT_576927 [Mytilinidion resinicola]
MTATHDSQKAKIHMTVLARGSNGRYIMGVSCSYSELKRSQATPYESRIHLSTRIPIPNRKERTPAKQSTMKMIWFIVTPALQLLTISFASPLPNTIVPRMDDKLKKNVYYLFDCSPGATIAYYDNINLSQNQELPDIFIGLEGSAHWGEGIAIQAKFGGSTILIPDWYWPWYPTLVRKPPGGLDMWVLVEDTLDTTMIWSIVVLALQLLTATAAVPYTPELRKPEDWTNEYFLASCKTGSAVLYYNDKTAHLQALDATAYLDPFSGWEGKTNVAWGSNRATLIQETLGSPLPAEPGHRT